MPVGYDTPVNEYWNTIERAGLGDVGVQRCVEITGPDAEVFTNLLTPRDISRVSVNQCRYLLITDQNGGSLNDPMILHRQKTHSNWGWIDWWIFQNPTLSANRPRKIHTQGIKRKMVGVFIDGKAFEKNNEHRWTVTSKTRPVGVVTAAVYSPRLDRNIGFALLEHPLSDKQELRTETPEGIREIKITSLPFIARDKKIPRSSLR